MKPLPVIAIFDIGKTNKKLFLFDKQYKIVFERSFQIEEIKDEDGDPCEDLDALRYFISDSLNKILSKKEYDLKAVNYAGYGASLVYTDKKGKVITPLYNYLKKYPAYLTKKFYATWGSESAFAHRTASPLLGSLNSGLQLYRIKNEKPELFRHIYKALHLPQYLGYLITGKRVSEKTSIGCHTGLWDFTRNQYHEWVKKEEIKNKLPRIYSSATTMNIVCKKHTFISGIGLHDSSAALISYLINIKEPFILLSTGTWNITLNPFNQKQLTTTELQHDCLFYISYKGIPVKASRFFAGNEHDQHVKLFASYFHKSLQFYKKVAYDTSWLKSAKHKKLRNLSPYLFTSFEEAYHLLILSLVKKQFKSSEYVMTGNIKKIIVDGGFSKNIVFMNMLAGIYPGKEVYAASISQSTALGAALAIHDKWNELQVPVDLIKLSYYKSQ